MGRVARLEAEPQMAARPAASPERGTQLRRLYPHVRTGDGMSTTRYVAITGRIPVGDGYLDIRLLADLAYATEADRKYILTVIEHIGTHLLVGKPSKFLRDARGRFAADSSGAGLSVGGL